MSKINTIIFDFGDVFINLDKQGAMHNALQLFKLKHLDEDLIRINTLFELGKITSLEFINFYARKFPNLNSHQLTQAWNYIIKDFPKYRLDFLQNISKNNAFKLILLSNTNALHIDYIKSKIDFYQEFKSYFHKFYLSHEISLRKPDRTIFEFVLNDNHLEANQCLFIDDTKEHICTAQLMGFHTWHIDETKDDVITLFETKKHLL